MYVLDTNVLSELRAGKPRVEPAVIRWAESIPFTQIYLSAITILEVEQALLLQDQVIFRTIAALCSLIHMSSEIVFSALHNIPRIGKGRHPSAFQISPGVATGMIEVKMRKNDGSDVAG